MKKVLILLTSFLFLTCVNVPAYADLQTNSNTIDTKVGNPLITGVTGGGKAGDVLSWASQISNELEAGYDGAFDRMTASITNGSYTTQPAPGTSVGNIYWCTYLIVDSFNLAGITGLSRGADAAVVNMISAFQNTPGLKYLDYYNGNRSQVLSQVQPGYAIFYQSSPGSGALGDLDHTAIIKTISVNSHGDGQIETMDANISGGRKVLSYTIDGWDIKWRTSPVVGFGTNQ